MRLAAGILAAAVVGGCVAAQRGNTPGASDPGTSAAVPPVATASTEGVDGINVQAFDLVRAGGVVAAHLEHVEARTWRVTFPGLNARTAQVSGRSVCCVTFSDFDFLGISSLDVMGPDIGGEDRVGVRAANLVGPPEHTSPDPRPDPG